MWLHTNTRGFWRRLLLYDLPVLLYAGLIFWVSHHSPSSLQKKWLTIIPDVVLHGAEYFVLACLLFRALRIPGRLENLRQAALVAALVAVLYGASDEIHQWFIPGRYMELKDWLADSLGALLGATLAALFQKRLEDRKATLNRNRH